MVLWYELFQSWMNSLVRLEQERQGEVVVVGEAGAGGVQEPC